MLLTLLSVGFFLLLIGTITDLWYREVPDWMSFSGIFAGLGLRLVWSVQTQVWSYIQQGIVGFAVLFAFGWLMFKMGQWGGGDSKVMMALGAILGLTFNLDSLLLAFFINAMFVGAVYGFLWSFILAILNWKGFKKHLKKIMALTEFKKTRRKSLMAAVGLVAVSFFVPPPLKIVAIATAFMVFLIAHMYAFIKAVELACMYKKISPDQLTEGDWIAKDIKIKGKYICGPKDLGIENRQIRILKKSKIKQVLIRIGIPFVPTFLIAYILMLWIGNPLAYLI